jgi:hypothetical protein
LKVGIFGKLDVEDENNKRSFENAVKIAKAYEYEYYSTFKVRCATKFTSVVLEVLEKALKNMPKHYYVKLKSPKLII